MKLRTALFVNVDHKEMMIIPYLTSIPIREHISIADVGNRTKLL